MGLEQFMKNMGAGIENMAKARKRRLADPSFKAEMALERVEFNKSLTNMGEKTWASISSSFQAPFKILGAQLRLNEKNYKGGDAIIDSCKAVGTGAWDVTKLFAASLVVMGRGVKIAGRYLVAK